MLDADFRKEDDFYVMQVWVWQPVRWQHPPLSRRNRPFSGA
jgi:hypothetical protein